MNVTSKAFQKNTILQNQLVQNKLEIAAKTPFLNLVHETGDRLLKNY